jgi:septal ring factor EnvC (AmiA/AmiB activator)
VKCYEKQKQSLFYSIDGAASGMSKCSKVMRRSIGAQVKRLAEEAGTIDDQLKNTVSYLKACEKEIADEMARLQMQRDEDAAKLQLNAQSTTKHVGSLTTDVPRLRILRPVLCCSQNSVEAAIRSAS